MCLQYVLKMFMIYMIMLYNHSQLSKCTHQCCIDHLYRHLRIHSKKSASRYAVQMEGRERPNKHIVKQTW